MTPPQFERRNERLHAPTHVQEQYPQAPPQARHFPAAPPRRTRARRPPYPAHLVRFPSGALPRSRRTRGPSARRIFYLGRHPIALMIEMCLTLLALEVIVGWIALVVAAWAMWTAIVTVAWLCQSAAAAVRG